jgi:hypothetical protein
LCKSRISWPGAYWGSGSHDEETKDSAGRRFGLSYRQMLAFAMNGRMSEDISLDCSQIHLVLEAFEKGDDSTGHMAKGLSGPMWRI